MSHDLPTGWNIRTVSNLEYTKFVSIWNQIWPLHPQTVDELSHDQTSIPVDRRSRLFFITVDREPAGYAELGWDIGSYHPQRFISSVGICPAMRRRGLGSALFEHVLREVEFARGKSLTARVMEDDECALSFAEHRGFRVQKKDFESILDIEEVNFEAFGNVSKIQDIAISSARDLDSLQFRKALHELFEQVRRDVPRSSPPTRLTFEEFDSLVLQEPNFLLDAMVCAHIGDQLIGFTGGYRHPDTATFQQWLTGVHPTWRRRGLARAMKINALIWLKNHQFRFVRTDNDSRNGSMLAINRQLGFRPLPATLTLTRDF